MDDCKRCHWMKTEKCVRLTCGYIEILQRRFVEIEKENLKLKEQIDYLNDKILIQSTKEP